jgi:TRAP transporter TAXI family solute receptor
LRFLAALTGAFVLLAILVRDPREFARRHGATQRISVATGGTGGVWYPYGGAVAKVISAHVPGVEVTAEVTAGTVDNLKFIRDGAADVGFAMADGLEEAFRGEGPFAGTGKVPVRAVAVLYDNYTQIVTMAGKGIARVADLKGKVVSTGAPGSGTETIALRILRAAGLDPDRDIRRQGLSAAQSADALRDGKLDAFIWSGGMPSGAILDLATSFGSRLQLVPSDDILPALDAQHPGLYRVSAIPRSAYPRMPADVPSIVVSNVLVVDEAMSDALAYDITRALFDHQAELIAVHREAMHLSLATAAAGSPVPFHPGAIRYYRERGAWRE